jgi:hypothetical protein
MRQRPDLRERFSVRQHGSHPVCRRARVGSSPAAPTCGPGAHRAGIGRRSRGAACRRVGRRQSADGLALAATVCRGGVDGLLRDKTRKPGKPPIPAETGARVVALTCGAPPGEATHWTGRAMAKAIGISLRSVQRI